MSAIYNLTYAHKLCSSVRCFSCKTSKPLGVMMGDCTKLGWVPKGIHQLA